MALVSQEPTPQVFSSTISETKNVVTDLIFAVFNGAASMILGADGAGGGGNKRID